MIKRTPNTLTNPKTRMTQLEAQIDGLAKQWQSRVDGLLDMIKEVGEHSKSVRIDATRNFHDVIDRIEALEKRDHDISGLVARNIETFSVRFDKPEDNADMKRFLKGEDKVKPLDPARGHERTLMDRQADQIIALQQELDRRADQIIALQQELDIAREQAKAFEQIALEMASKFPKPLKVASILKGEYVQQAPSRLALMNEIEFLLHEVTHDNLKHVVAYVQSHKQTVFEVLLFTLLVERDRKIVITPEFMDFAKRAKPYFMEMIK